MSRYRPSLRRIRPLPRPVGVVHPGLPPVDRRRPDAGLGVPPDRADRPVVPVRERDRRREGRPVQLPGDRAVPAVRGPRARGHASPRPAEPGAARRFTSPDPFARARAAGRALSGGATAGPAAVRRRGGRLCGLRRRPLHREPARRPARRSRPARPLVRLLRPDGPVRPHPQDDPGGRPGACRRRARPEGRLRRRPATGSTSWSIAWPRPGPTWASAISTPTRRSRSSPRSNFTREQYEAVVRHCQEYIKAGDIFQVVPSQRFAGRDAAPTRSTSTACCGSSIPARSCSICRSATSP